MKSQLVVQGNPMRLTLRDGELLLFLLEMKFGTKEELHSRFFKRLQSGETSESLAYVKERIALLKKNGFLISVKHPFDWKAVFLPTSKAYRWVLERFPGNDVPAPVGRLEIATFEHDAALLKIRMELEGRGEVRSWTSDRQLRSLPQVIDRFSGHYVPDAVVETLAGGRIALELEIAQKGKEKYREKIRRYVSVFRTGQIDLPFEKVVFICLKVSVVKILKHETRLYEEYFRVEHLDLSNFGGLNV